MGKKRKKLSVPKRIAGVKIPKPVRRGLRDLAASDRGRQAVGQALVAAAGVLAAAQARRGSATRRALEPATHEVRDRAVDQAHTVSEGAGALRNAVNH